MVGFFSLKQFKKHFYSQIEDFQPCSLLCKLSGIFSVLGKVFVTLNSNDTGLQVQQSLLGKDKKYISGIVTVSS